MPDFEIEAMTAVAEALSPLDQDSRQRVLHWALAKFGADAPRRSLGQLIPFDAVGEETSRSLPRFATFGELFHAAQPNGEREKALAAAYWVQQVGGADSFGSQTLNSLLKELGYGVSNITAALSQLQDERPALVIQLRKSGSSQQARKTYKLTDAGRRRFEESLLGGTQHA